MARQAGLEKQTIFNYLDTKKDTQPNKRTIDALFDAFPDLKQMFLDAGAYTRLSHVREAKVEYGPDEYSQAVGMLKDEIRDLYLQLKSKEALLKLLEMKTRHIETETKTETKSPKSGRK